MNILVFADGDLRDLPIHEWVDCRAHRVFLVVNAESQDQRRVDTEALRQQHGYAEVAAYGNYISNGAIDADVLAIHSRCGLDRLVVLGEDDVVRAARLRQALGLAGQSLASAVAYRDKGVMKTHLARAGVPTAPFQVLTSPLDLIAFKKRHGLPLFVKPTSSSGSTGLHTLRTEAEFRAFLTSGLRARIPYAEYSSDLLVETFVEGRLYHVDGMVLDGRLAFMVPGCYAPFAWPEGATAQKAARCSYTMEAADPLHRRLCAVVEETLAALPPAPSFSFHAELFHTVDDRVLLNEIASRTGGGKISSAIGLIAGTKLNHLAVAAQVDPAAAGDLLKRAVPVSPSAGLALVSPRGVEVTHLPDRAPWPWLSDFTTYVSAGYRAEAAAATAATVVAGVVSGPSAAEVQARLRLFNTWCLESFTRPL